MNPNFLKFLTVPLVFAVALFMSGCASMEAHDKESLLSAAGFKVRTPSTPAQQAIYQSLQPYKMSRRTVKGTLLYAYADPKQGVLYVGTEAEYQAYKKLSTQQNIAEEREMTAEMDQQDSLDWNAWGPMGMWY